MPNLMLKTRTHLGHMAESFVNWARLNLKGMVPWTSHLLILCKTIKYFQRIPSSISTFSVPHQDNFIEWTHQSLWSLRLPGILSKILDLWGYPFIIINLSVQTTISHGTVPKILSMELFEGRAQLKMENCLLSLSGISFLPPPGWIMAPMNWMSTMVVKSPGFSRLYMPLISIIWRVISLVTWNTQTICEHLHLCLRLIPLMFVTA